MICPKCGKIQSNGLYCTKCGTKLVNEQAVQSSDGIYCVKCGKYNSMGKYCTACGAMLRRNVIDYNNTGQLLKSKVNAENIRNAEKAYDLSYGSYTEKNSVERFNAADIIDNAAENSLFEEQDQAKEKLLKSVSNESITAAQQPVEEKADGYESLEDLMAGIGGTIEEESRTTDAEKEPEEEKTDKYESLEDLMASMGGTIEEEPRTTDAEKEPEEEINEYESFEALKSEIDAETEPEQDPENEDHSDYRDFISGIPDISINNSGSSERESEELKDVSNEDQSETMAEQQLDQNLWHRKVDPNQSAYENTEDHIDPMFGPPPKLTITAHKPQERQKPAGFFGKLFNR